MGANTFLRMFRSKEAHLMKGIRCAFNSASFIITSNKTGVIKYETSDYDELYHFLKRDNEKTLNAILGHKATWKFYLTLYCTKPDGTQYNRHIPAFERFASFLEADAFIRKSILPKVMNRECVEWGFFGEVI